VVPEDDLLRRTAANVLSACKKNNSGFRFTVAGNLQIRPDFENCLRIFQTAHRVLESRQVGWSYWFWVGNLGSVEPD
jgi:hypothetical protein